MKTDTVKKSCDCCEEHPTKISINCRANISMSDSLEEPAKVYSRSFTNIISIIIFFFMTSIWLGSILYANIQENRFSYENSTKQLLNESETKTLDETSKIKEINLADVLDIFPLLFPLAYSMLLLGYLIIHYNLIKIISRDLSSSLLYKHDVTSLLFEVIISIIVIAIVEASKFSISLNSANTKTTLLIFLGTIFLVIFFIFFGNAIVIPIKIKRMKEGKKISMIRFIRYGLSCILPSFFGTIIIIVLYTLYIISFICNCRVPINNGVITAKTSEYNLIFLKLFMLFITMNLLNRLREPFIIIKEVLLNQIVMQTCME